jgi:hypothetical protein
VNLANDLLKLATVIPEHGKLLTDAADELYRMAACLALVRGAIKELPKGRQE